MSDYFSTLLACESCHHSVDLHDGNGCGQDACACPHSRIMAIDLTTETARSEWFNGQRSA